MVSVLLPLMALAYSGLLNVATLATLRVGSPLFTALAGYEAKFLGGWAIVAALALLRLRRTAALAATALLICLVYSIADAPNWAYIDAPSMRSLCVAGLEIAALLASPGPRRGLQIINWRHYALALAIPLGLAAVSNWVWLADPAVSNSIVITACAVTLAGMTLASPIARRAAGFLALPVYYLIATFVVPPSMIGGPYESVSGWEGPLRVTVTCAPFAVLLCVALVVALRTVRHPPSMAGKPDSQRLNPSLLLSPGQDAGKRTGCRKSTNARHYRPRMVWIQPRPRPGCPRASLLSSLARVSPPLKRCNAAGA